MKKTEENGDLLFFGTSFQLFEKWWYFDFLGLLNCCLFLTMINEFGVLSLQHLIEVIFFS